MRGYLYKTDPKQSRKAPGLELGEIICSNSQSWGAKRRVPRSKSNEKMLTGWKERVLVGAGRMDRFREDVSGAWANDKE